MSSSLAWLFAAFPNLSDWRELSRGGQKLVLWCEHADLGTCVLKVVWPGHERYLDREDEAVKRLLSLSSPRVPRIHEIRLQDSPMGRPVWCILEQYVEGTLLQDMLARGPLTREQVLHLSLDLVSITRDAESVDVVHRDIKPKNIIIDTVGNAWLLDFGIARVLDLESKTGTSARQGPHSPGYSAPEQFRYEKRKITGRSDLFAIGVVLYESATGSNPFREGTSDHDEIRRRTAEDRLPPLNLAWDVDRKFSDYVASLTQKQPHQRPRNCAEAYDWLVEIVTDLGGL